MYPDYMIKAIDILDLSANLWVTLRMYGKHMSNNIHRGW